MVQEATSKEKLVVILVFKSNQKVIKILDKTRVIVNNVNVGRAYKNWWNSSTPTDYNFDAITATANASNSIIICLTIVPSFPTNFFTNCVCR